MEFEYECSQCQKRFGRRRTAQDHCVTPACLKDHPLGRDTPIIKRAKATCSESAESRPVPTEDTLVQARRIIKELELLVQAAPECRFLCEPLPDVSCLKAKLVDVFNGGVVAHLTWTHVHTHKTVRKSDRPGYLRTYGTHGWISKPAEDVARASVDSMQNRLERMWLLLDRSDPKACNTLRPMMMLFSRSRVMQLDREVFGLEDAVVVKQCPKKYEAVVQEAAESFTEYTLP